MSFVVAFPPRFPRVQVISDANLGRFQSDDNVEHLTHPKIGACCPGLSCIYRVFVFVVRVERFALEGDATAGFNWMGFCLFDVSKRQDIHFYFTGSQSNIINYNARYI